MQANDDNYFKIYMKKTPHQLSCSAFEFSTLGSLLLNFLSNYNIMTTVIQTAKDVLFANDLLIGLCNTR